MLSSIDLDLSPIDLDPSQLDVDDFGEQYADLKWMENKVAGQPINRDARRGAKKARRYPNSKVSGGERRRRNDAATDDR